MPPEIFISCPFTTLCQDHLDEIIDMGLNVEIGLNCGALHSMDRSKFKEVAERLAREGRKALIHAPFTDLSLGAADPLVREAVLERQCQALEVAGLMGAAKMVLHTGFDRRHYWGMEAAWIARAADSLIKLASKADEYSVELVLENVFEADWRIHDALFRAVGEANMGFCYDIGHHKVFSKTPQEEWLRNMGNRLSHCHLHDNHGRHDDHIAIGAGTLDFEGLFQWLASRKREGMTLTIEAHRREDVRPSLDNLYRLIDKYGL